jgi:hypothetical protein
VANQGAFYTACLYYFMPAMQNIASGWAIIYAVSLANGYPNSAYQVVPYTGGTGPSYYVANSTGPTHEYIDPGCNCARWGDYLASFTDNPSNDTYAWTIGEYQDSADHWHTWIDQVS